MSSKFDIGDKVKFINYCCGYDVGDIGIIVYVGKFFHDYIVNFDLDKGYKESNNVHVYEFDLELVSKEGEYEW